MRRLGIHASAAVVCACALAGGCRGSTPPTTQTLVIGALLPKTGSLSQHGAAASAALEVATQELNAYFEAAGSTIRIEVHTADTKSTADGAFEALRGLAEGGLHSFVGPYGSDELTSCLGLSDRLKALLISPFGGAAELAVADDSVVRYVPTHDLAAQALTAYMAQAGVRRLAFLSRTDEEASGFRSAITMHFTAAGGTVLGLVIVPELALGTNNFDVPLGNLTDLLNSNGADVESNGIGVVLLANEESAVILNQAAQKDGLDAVRWFGTEMTARLDDIASNPAAGAFAASVHFTAPLLLLPDAERTTAVVQAVTARLGAAPDPYAIVAYDALTTLALTASSVSSPNDAAVLLFQLPAVLEVYNGATGTIALDDADDRTTANYELVEVAAAGNAGQWNRVATFIDGVFAVAEPPAATPQPSPAPAEPAEQR